MPKGFTKKELVFSIPITLVVLGLIAWGIWYEYARAGDTARYADALQWHSAMQLYFKMHGVYPVAPQDGMNLSGVCLVDSGFVALTSAACSESVRVYHASARSDVEYYSRSDDNSVCADIQGCARYYMKVKQTTRAISGQDRGIFRIPPRGQTLFGPEGYLPTQKQIPGL